MEFSAEVNSIIEAEIQRMEESKQKYAELGRKASLICYPAAGALLLSVFYFSLGGFFWFLVLFVFGIPSILKSINRSSLVTQVKQNLLIPVLGEIMPDITYTPTLCVPQESFESSDLFERPSRYKGEDLFEGIHGKTTFSFSEIHAEKKTGSKNNNYKTIFKGLFLVADFNKKLANETFVFTSGGGKWFSKYKRVRLENPEFESNFKVFSDNEVEARYVLTPSMMERLIALEKLFEAQLFASFRGNNVYIALENRHNFFETDVTAEITKQVIEDVVAEIDICVGIIDELDLNTRIWTKQ
ncbi:MAG: DUF3137 domain-containing protein [Flavobacteriales bacterium]